MNFIDNIKYKVSFTENVITATAVKDNIEIGKLTVGYKEEKLPSIVPSIFGLPLSQVLTISGWYVNSEYQHMGIGKNLLRKVFLSINPTYISEIKYVWNGTNEYVGEWLNKFDAVNNCPITFLKNSEEDSWECHLYTLNKDKFLDYLNDVK